MHFKKKIQRKVYHMYLNSILVLDIAIFLKLDVEDVNEIIDYLNSIYN